VFAIKSETVKVEREIARVCEDKVTPPGRRTPKLVEEASTR
jgi:hypothetical protein